MRQQRTQDTAPELALRRALHRLGLRYRLQAKVIAGTRRRVDIVHRPTKTAIDVRGCFWHGHEHELAAYERRTNLAYWGPKLERNRARDADTAERLRAVGWHLEVVWECEDPEAAASRIVEAIAGRR